MRRQFRNIISILTGGEKKKFINLVLFDLVASVLDIAFLVALLYVVGFYTGSYKAGKLFFLQVSIFEKYPLLLISAFFILFSLKNLFGWLVVRMQYRYIYHVASRISKDSLQAYFESDYNDFVSVDSSVYIRKISQQPIEFAHYVLRGVQQIISSVILLLVTIIPILIFNSTLFGLLLLVLLPPAILTLLFARKKLAAIRAESKKTREKAVQHLQEALSGFIEINIYDQKSFFLRRYEIFQEKFNDSLAELQVVQSIPSKLMEVFAVFGLFILVTATSLARSTDPLHVLLIGGFMAAAYKIIPGVVKILNSREQIKTYGFTIDELSKIPTNQVVSENSSAPIDKIELRNISFSYKDLRVFDHFSITFGKGDFVVLSGNSGTGKTTLVNLLLGFLDPSSGSILINDELVDSGAIKKSWNKIAYSPQQPFFIHESVKTNILLGKAFDEGKFNEVIAVTGIDRLITQFPDGVDTILAEKAKNISGGQSQRVILARALYTNADLIILDEPFNELDRESANSLLSHLQGLAGSGKMILLVTHDEQSLSWANKTISLDEK